jgi:serine phosphatase RsbU (regulator of sigma subunit)
MASAARPSPSVFAILRVGYSGRAFDADWRWCLSELGYKVGDSNWMECPMLAGSGVDGARRSPARSALTLVDGIDFHVQYHSDRTGGDFCDAVRVGSRVAFLLSDIAGRRRDADPVAVEAQGVFRARAAELLESTDANLMDGTALLVQALNLALMGAGRQIRFAPTFVGCYDVQLGVLAYINAGGQTAAIRDGDGARALPNVAMPLGLFTHLTYEPSMQAFEPGSRLLVVTKGVTQSMQGRTEFGAARVIEVLRDSGDNSAAEVCEKVLESARRFEKLSWAKRLRRKDEAREDMTALALVRSAGAP